MDVCVCHDDDVYAHLDISKYVYRWAYGLEHLRHFSAFLRTPQIHMFDAFSKVIYIRRWLRWAAIEQTAYMTLNDAKIELEQ